MAFGLVFSVFVVCVVVALLGAARQIKWLRQDHEVLRSEMEAHNFWAVEENQNRRNEIRGIETKSAKRKGKKS